MRGGLYGSITKEQQIQNDKERILKKFNFHFNSHPASVNNKSEGINSNFTSVRTNTFNSALKEKEENQQINN
ncbi:MAG: hypothetical protein MJ252_24505, partial [archaeon]|nr:hypothetical protein [archaeon]